MKWFSSESKWILSFFLSKCRMLLPISNINFSSKSLKSAFPWHVPQTNMSLTSCCNNLFSFILKWDLYYLLLFKHSRLETPWSETSGFRWTKSTLRFVCDGSLQGWRMNGCVPQFVFDFLFSVKWRLKRPKQVILCDTLRGICTFWSFFLLILGQWVWLLSIIS